MPAYYDVDSARPPSQGPGLLMAIRRHPFLVIACIIVAAGLGVLATMILPTHYTAQAEVVIGDQNDAMIFRTVPQLNVTAKAETAAQIMRSAAVYTRASDILNHRLSPSDVLGSVAVTPGASNPLVTVAATNDSAKLARDEANAVGQAYLDVTKAQNARRADRAQAALKNSQAQTQTQLTSIRTQAANRAQQIQSQTSTIVSPVDRARAIQASLGSDSEYQGLTGQAAALTTSLGTIKAKLQETKIDASLVSDGVDTLYAASTPDSVTSANLKRNVAIAAALGLLIGAAFAWRRLDRERGLDQQEVASTLDAPLLGKVKRDRELRDPTRAVDLTPGRRLPDDLRVLGSSLMLHMRRRGLAGSVITSAKPGEGKTVLALNLAAALSSAGHDVVLVDGDVRNAALTEAADLDASPGLLDLLEGANLGDVFGTLSYAPDRTLPIIPIGRRRDGGEPPMSGFPALRRGNGSVPAAIVDSPAVLEDPVTLLLASGSAGLVVIVSNVSTLDDLRTLRSRAELAGAPILGFIVNDFRPNRRRSGGRAQRQRHRRGEKVEMSAAARSAVATH